MTRAEIDRAMAEALRPQRMELRPDLARAIEQQMSRDLRPVRSLRPASWYAVGFALIFLAPVVAGLAMLRAAGLAHMGSLTQAVEFGALAGCAILLAISLAAEMSPGSCKPGSPLRITLAVLMGLAAVSLVLLPYRPEVHFWSASGRCFSLGADFALPAAGLTWALLRRGELLSPLATGAAAGLLGGLAGLTVLEIHCPDLNCAHVLAAHWSLALAGAGLGCLVACLGNLRIKYP